MHAALGSPRVCTQAHHRRARRSTFREGTSGTVKTGVGHTPIHSIPPWASPLHSKSAENLVFGNMFSVPHSHVKECSSLFYAYPMFIFFR